MTRIAREDTRLYNSLMLPPFSVVIPCFNEAARIGTTIRATLDYLYKNSPESELIDH